MIHERPFRRPLLRSSAHPVSMHPDVSALLAVQNDDTLTYENLLTTMADALAALADAAVGRRRSGRTAS